MPQPQDLVTLGFSPSPGYIEVNTASQVPSTFVVRSGQVFYIKETKLFYIGDGVTQFSSLTTVGNTIGSGGASSVQLGLNAAATNADTIAIGQGTTATAGGSISLGRSSVASGNSSIAIGYNAASASGTASIAIGTGSSAPQVNAIAIGASSTSTGGGNTIAIGASSSANGTASVAIGNASSATSINTVALGAGTAANASDSTASGLQAVNAKPYTFGYCSGIITVNSDAMAYLCTAGIQTTTASLTEIQIGAARGTAYPLNVASGRVLAFKIAITAIRTDVSGTCAAWPHIVGAVARDATGNCRFLGAVVGAGTTTLADAGAATWSVSLTADTVNNRIAIGVTGEAAKTIKWLARIEFSEGY